MSIYNENVQLSHPDYGAAFKQGMEIGNAMKTTMDTSRMNAMSNEFGSDPAAMKDALQKKGTYAQQRQYEGDQNASNTAKLNGELERAEYLGQIIGGTRDQQSWDAGLMEAERAAPGSTASIDKIFSEQAKMNAQQRSISYANKVKSQFGDRQQTEVERHNKAMELNTAAGGGSASDGVFSPFKATTGGKPIDVLISKNGGDPRDLYGRPVNVDPGSLVPQSQAAMTVGAAAAARDQGGNVIEAANAANSADVLSNKYEKALDIVAGKKDEYSGERSGDGRGRMGQLAGTMPNVSAVLGLDVASKNKFLQELVVDETLLRIADTKGSITEAENKLFRSPMPPVNAADSVWKEYIEDRIPVIRKLEAIKRQQAAYGQAGNSQTTSGQDPDIAAFARDNNISYEEAAIEAGQ